MSKNVLVYGFSRNAFVFMLPAMRYILGQNKFSHVRCVDEAWKSFYSADVICINCGLAFYEMGVCFNIIEKVFTEKKPLIICLSWQEVPEENLNFLLEHQVKLIMFDLENEEEFLCCHEAFVQGKFYRAKNTFNRDRRIYCDEMEIYERLSKNQKYAFHYMMTGMSQKQFQIDFGYHSLSTASSHWNMVLQKFGVSSHYELRAKFR